MQVDLWHDLRLRRSARLRQQELDQQVIDQFAGQYSKLIRREKQLNRQIRDCSMKISISKARLQNKETRAAIAVQAYQRCKDARQRAGVCKATMPGKRVDHDIRCLQNVSSSSDVQAKSISKARDSSSQYVRVSGGTNQYVKSLISTNTDRLSIYERYALAINPNLWHAFCDTVARREAGDISSQE